MNGYFAPNITSVHVRNKTPVFSRFDNVDWSWPSAIKFLDTMPESHIDYHHDKMRFFLKSAHKRGSSPRFSRDIHEKMSSVFWKNPITNIMFYGFGSDCESYPWHKDRMDVFLVQVLGDIQIRVENTEWENEPKTFSVGECVFIPRGTHHQIITGKSRVTFSFGVEGEPDPSTYI
mgnify:CR=1 FL=1